MQRNLVIGLALVLVLGGAVGAFLLSKQAAPAPPPQMANAGSATPSRSTARADTAAPTARPPVREETPSATPPKTAEARTPSNATGRPNAGTATPPREGSRPNAGATNSGRRSENGGAPFDREKFVQFQETHKYTFQLMGLVGNIMRMERDGKTPLTAQQAKELLAVLQPLRKQEKLTQDDAKAAIRDVQRVLTEAQRNAIAAMPERDGGRRATGGGGGAGNGGGMRGGPPPGGGAPPPGGPGGGPGGAPGGRGGAGGDGARGARPMMDPTTMQNFNPFYKPDGEDTGRMSRRWDTLFETLEKKAGQ